MAQIVLPARLLPQPQLTFNSPHLSPTQPIPLSKALSPTCREPWKLVMKLATSTALTAPPVAADRATSIGKLRVVHIFAAMACPPPSHRWPRTKTQCWLMIQAAATGALGTTRCHARHGTWHSANVDRRCSSPKAAQCSGAHWVWDIVVLLTPRAHYVPTLPVVGAYTSTGRSGGACLRPCITYMALPHPWSSVRHRWFSDSGTEQRMFDALA
jgi:hypothetical protein